jgi:RNA polymerase sigma-70 factor (ECF subfamily)
MMDPQQQNPLAGPALSISDTALMERIAAGDREALAALVRRHQDGIRRLAFRQTGRWDVADDVAQEAFLRLWRSAGSFRGSASFTTWLYRIVVNLCLDWSKRRRLPSLPEDYEPADAAPSNREEVVQRVQAAVAALPERQRMALVLHRFEGLSHAQIAATTGWSESAVESLLVRAYGALRKYLAGPDGSETQDSPA